MRDKPQSCYDSGCLLANTCRHCKKLLETHANDLCEDGKEFESLSRGFVLGSGNPKLARYAFVLEAPGREEVSFRLAPVTGRAFFDDVRSVTDELRIRERDYPLLESSFRVRGAPVVGASGAQLQYQAWPKAGINRNEVFLDNTIRCLPPKSKNGAAYPTGKIKSSAEACCRQYDKFDQFRPDTFVTSLHPAGILRDITPLPLQVKDMEKVRDFTAQGRRVLALLGGKAVQAFLRFGGNVTKWRGDYGVLGRNWINEYKDRFVVKKVTKKPKLSADELEDEFFPVSPRLKAKRTEKRTRPAELDPKPCKSFKRYGGKRPPKCSCVTCWDKYEEKNK
jgi:uracil-DNA glycosylase